VPIQGLNVTDRLLTVRQVAERLQVHPNTVKKLSIPFTRIGSVRRYHPAAVAPTAEAFVTAYLSLYGEAA
jgi:hypothetical protein